MLPNDNYPDMDYIKAQFLEKINSIINLIRTWRELHCQPTGPYAVRGTSYDSIDCNNEIAGNGFERVFTLRIVENEPQQQFPVLETLFFFLFGYLMCYIIKCGFRVDNRNIDSTKEQEKSFREMQMNECDSDNQNIESTSQDQSITPPESFREVASDEDNNLRRSVSEDEQNHGAETNEARDNIDEADSDSSDEVLEAQNGFQAIADVHDVPTEPNQRIPEQVNQSNASANAVNNQDIIRDEENIIEQDTNSIEGSIPVSAVKTDDAASKVEVSNHEQNELDKIEEINDTTENVKDTDFDKQGGINQAEIKVDNKSQIENDTETSIQLINRKLDIIHQNIEELTKSITTLIKQLDKGNTEEIPIKTIPIKPQDYEDLSSNKEENLDNAKNLQSEKFKEDGNESFESLNNMERGESSTSERDAIQIVEESKSSQIVVKEIDENVSTTAQIATHNSQPDSGEKFVSEKSMSDENSTKSKTDCSEENKVKMIAEQNVIETTEKCVEQKTEGIKKNNEINVAKDLSDDVTATLASSTTAKDIKDKNIDTNEVVEKQKLMTESKDSENKPKGNLEQKESDAKEAIKTRVVAKKDSKDPSTTEEVNLDNFKSILSREVESKNNESRDNISNVENIEASQLEVKQNNKSSILESQNAACLSQLNPEEQSVANESESVTNSEISGGDNLGKNHPMLLTNTEQKLNEKKTEGDTENINVSFDQNLSSNTSKATTASSATVKSIEDISEDTTEVNKNHKSVLESKDEPNYSEKKLEENFKQKETNKKLAIAIAPINIIDNERGRPKDDTQIDNEVVTENNEVNKKCSQTVNDSKDLKQCQEKPKEEATGENKQSEEDKTREITSISIKPQESEDSGTAKLENLDSSNELLSEIVKNTNNKSQTNISSIEKENKLNVIMEESAKTEDDKKESEVSCSQDLSQDLNNIATGTSASDSKEEIPNKHFEKIETDQKREIETTSVSLNPKDKENQNEDSQVKTEVQSKIEENNLTSSQNINEIRDDESIIESREISTTTNSDAIQVLEESCTNQVKVKEEDENLAIDAQTDTCYTHPDSEKTLLTENTNRNTNSENNKEDNSQENQLKVITEENVIQTQKKLNEENTEDKERESEASFSQGLSSDITKINTVTFVSDSKKEMQDKHYETPLNETAESGFLNMENKNKIIQNEDSQTKAEEELKIVDESKTRSLNINDTKDLEESQEELQTDSTGKNKQLKEDNANEMQTRSIKIKDIEDPSSNKEKNFENSKELKTEIMKNTSKEIQEDESNIESYDKSGTTNSNAMQVTEKSCTNQEEVKQNDKNVSFDAQPVTYSTLPDSEEILLSENPKSSTISEDSEKKISQENQFKVITEENLIQTHKKLDEENTEKNKEESEVSCSQRLSGDITKITTVSPVTDSKEEIQEKQLKKSDTDHKESSKTVTGNPQKELLKQFQEIKTNVKELAEGNTNTVESCEESSSAKRDTILTLEESQTCELEKIRQEKKLSFDSQNASTQPDSKRKSSSENSISSTNSVDSENDHSEKNKLKVTAEKNLKENDTENKNEVSCNIDLNKDINKTATVTSVTDSKEEIPEKQSEKLETDEKSTTETTSVSIKCDDKDNQKEDTHIKTEEESKVEENNLASLQNIIDLKDLTENCEKLIKDSTGQNELTNESNAEELKTESIKVQDIIDLSSDNKKTPENAIESKSETVRNTSNNIQDDKSIDESSERLNQVFEGSCTNQVEVKRDDKNLPIDAQTFAGSTRPDSEKSLLSEKAKVSTNSEDCEKDNSEENQIKVNTEANVEQTHDTKLNEDNKIESEISCIQDLSKDVSETTAVTVKILESNENINKDISKVVEQQSLIPESKDNTGNSETDKETIKTVPARLNNKNVDIFDQENVDEDEGEEEEDEGEGDEEDAIGSPLTDSPDCDTKVHATDNTEEDQGQCISKPMWQKQKKKRRRRKR